MIIPRRISYHYRGMNRDYLRLLFLKSKIDYIKLFEQKISSYLNVPAAVCTSFGCHALSIALDFYCTDKTKKVILPSYTAKVVERVLIEKGIPYLTVDIDPLTANISIKNLEQISLTGCSAIVITHLFGIVVQKDVIDYCRSFGLVVIEDCAHAQGAKFADGHSVGTYGEAGFYSFGYSKIINTFTGGLLISGNDLLLQYARTEVLRRRQPSALTMLQRLIFANTEKLFTFFSWIPFVKYLLYNETLLRKFKTFLNYIVSPRVTKFYKYTNAQAYLGLKQLDTLSENLEARKVISQHYEKNLGLINFLKRNPGDVYYNQILIVSRAPDLRQKLISNGIDCGTGPSVMEKIGFSQNVSGADFAYSSYLQVPLYKDINTETVDTVSEKIKLISKIFK